MLISHRAHLIFLCLGNGYTQYEIILFVVFVYTRRVKHLLETRIRVGKPPEPAEINSDDNATLAKNTTRTSIHVRLCTDQRKFERRRLNFTNRKADEIYALKYAKHYHSSLSNNDLCSAHKHKSFVLIYVFSCDRDANGYY